MQRVLLCLYIGLLCSCGNKTASPNSVYFAGEIVNPTSDYVVLYKNDVVVDSAKLDDNNRFSFCLESIEEGLHHFDHAPELQYIYLEKGDSILVRLNTVAFDESLVFSGSNEDINNFMIEMFLAYEDEEQLVYSYYELSPEEFSQKIDSLRQMKLEELSELSTTEALTENAFAMAKASIDYNSFIFKEKYPFYHKKKTGEDTFHELDSSFYDYRKTLDVNNKDLSFFRPYYEFMKNHFGNLSYMACAKNCGMDFHKTDKKHLHHNQHKILVIDSMVKEKSIRDNLFRNVAMDYLLKVHMANEDCDNFIEKFEEISMNDRHKEEIKYLYEGIKSLQPYEEIPDITVQDVAGNETTLKAISRDNNAVFYFWTGTQKRHFKNVTKHIEKLKAIYPNVEFVGINLKTSKTQWLGMLEENDIDIKNQFWGEDFKKIQHTLIVDGLNKCVITEDTLIVDGFANLYYSFGSNKKALTLK